MIRTLLILFAFCFPSLGHTFCSGPSQFDNLTAEERKMLREKAHAEPHSQGLLWQIEKNGIQSYIVGTMHFPDPRHKDTLTVLAPLMNDTRVLFLELTKPDEVAFTQQLTSDPSIYLINEGPSLIDRLGEEAWQTLKTNLNERSFPSALAARYQPWFLALTLSIPPCAQNALQSGKVGLDRMVESAALEIELETRSLDSAQSMIDLLAADPIDTQVEDLRIALETDTFGKSYAEAMVAFYFDQETVLAWEFSIHEAYKAAEEIHIARLDDQIARMEEALVTNRNQVWFDVLKTELAKTPSTVAVGALHLPGEQGLLALLEGEGFKVIRVEIPNY